MQPAIGWAHHGTGIILLNLPAYGEVKHLVGAGELCEGIRERLVGTRLGEPLELVCQRADGRAASGLIGVAYFSASGSRSATSPIQVGGRPLGPGAGRRGPAANVEPPEEAADL